MRINRIEGSDPDAVPERKRASRPRSRSAADGGIRRRQGARDTTQRRSVAMAFVLLALVFLILQPNVAAQAGNTSSTGGPRSVSAGDVFTVLALVLVTMLFVLAETALLTVRRTRIEQLVEQGNRSARLASQLLAEPTRMLATLQVGLTLVQLFSAGEATTRFVGPFRNFLERRAPTGFIHQNADSIAFITTILTVGLLTLVIGEIAPKSLGLRFNEKLSLICSWPIRWLQIGLAPLVWVVTFLSNMVVRPLGGTATFHTTAMSEEEIKLMVEESEEHGVIETEEKEMIHSIFEFSDTVVRKVMTPRPDITAIEADTSIDDMIRRVNDSGHSRLPVYDDDIDNVIGIVHVKDVLAAITGDSPPVSIRQVMRPAYFIPENKRVHDLLAEMRRNRLQIAIVRNPDDGTVTGVVTVEDLLEEIVGEIEDEYDEMVEPEVTQIDERTTVVDGRMSLDDFSERMGVDIPTDDSDTIGGFVFGLMGHQPEQGETTQWDGLEFKVEATDGKRIQKVCVIRHALPEDARTGQGGADSAASNGRAAVPTEDGRGPNPTASVE